MIRPIETNTLDVREYLAQCRARRGGSSNPLNDIALAMKTKRLEARTKILKIYLDGLRLPSWNALIGSRSSGAQARAKTLAAGALGGVVRSWVEGRIPLWRFDCVVDVRFVQFGDARIDPDNLVVKYVLDGLTTRGLGVLVDDKPDCVRDITRGNRRSGNTVGVDITIRPIHAPTAAMYEAGPVQFHEAEWPEPEELIKTHV